MKLKLLCNGLIHILNLLSGYANAICTPGGGTHISGFKTAITRVLNAVMLKKIIFLKILKLI